MQCLFQLIWAEAQDSAFLIIFWDISDAADMETTFKD